MTRQEFLNEMSDILELSPDALTGPEKLEDLEQWDSMAMMSFIALADTNNGTRVSPRQIANSATVEDLLRLAHVEGESS